ncbi:MAG TPA: hypothetical protein VK897_09780 [Anaerolineales bacterium]|nr:hypothetical protein [Anaerolineales bacterium]
MAKRTRIQGDVNITNGDFIAGDKTISHNRSQGPERPAAKKDVSHPKSSNTTRDLEVSGGDVVFGDKIIKFFQKNLNIYLFRDVQQLALFLGFLIVVSGTMGGAYWYSIQPKKMTGDYNIAIAQFGEIQEDGRIKSSKNAEKIRSTLFDFLDSEYRAAGLGLTIQVEYENLPLIREDAQAEKLADQINADIVIYGNVSVHGNKAEFMPRFYVAERPDTRELTGQNELAHPIEFKISELGAQDILNTELRTRTEILFNFTKGLIYFSEKELEYAHQSIQTAIAAAEKPPQPFGGQEVLYLFAAHIQASRKDYATANQSLEKALSLNPQYARAYLARGNFFYLQATSVYPPDLELLKRAQAEYMIAYEMPNQPLGAYIPAKAHYSLGNVLSVRAQVENNDPTLFAQAMENYLYVVREYERTQDPILEKLLDESYYGIGAIYQKQGATDQAVEAYQKAYELTNDLEFKAEIELRMNEVGNH